MGELGDKLSLKLRVRINDTEHLLNLDRLIRSVNTTRPANEDASTFLHGLSFENVSGQDILVISALLYQNIVNDKEAD